MRGASAVQSVLDEVERPDLLVLVVWEPVLLSDIAPPTTSVLGRIKDMRAVQFWDPERLLSKQMKSVAERAAAPDRPEGIPNEEGGPVWDYISVFPPGTTWSEVPLGASFSGCPVRDVIGEVRKRLLAPRARSAAPPRTRTAPARSSPSGSDSPGTVRGPWHQAKESPRGSAEEMSAQRLVGAMRPLGDNGIQVTRSEPSSAKAS